MPTKNKDFASHVVHRLSDVWRLFAIEMAKREQHVQRSACLRTPTFGRVMPSHYRRDNHRAASEPLTLQIRLVAYFSAGKSGDVAARLPVKDVKVFHQLGNLGAIQPSLTAEPLSGKVSEGNG